MSNLSAQAAIYIFQVGGDICTPVTLRTSDGDYTIYNSITIEEYNISWFEAFDCQGRKLLNPSGSVSHGTNKPTVYTYVFKTLFPNSSYNDNSGGYDNYDNYDDSKPAGASTIENTTRNITNASNEFANRGMGIPAVGYPNMSLNFGASRVYGEFVRIKGCLGEAGGYTLYGGIGKDWLFDGDNSDKLSWHVGMGYYGVFGYDQNQEFDWGVTFSETPACEDFALCMDLLYTYYFGRSKRFGLFGGAGIGVGKIKDPWDENEFDGKFLWDVQIGFSLKLFGSE